MGWRSGGSEGFASRPEIDHLGTVRGRAIEGRLLDVVLRHGDAEPRAKLAQLLLVELLLLVGHVATLARFAEPVALQGLGEDHGGRAAMLRGRLVRRVHLPRVVPTPGQAAELVVGEMLDERPEAGIPSEEPLAKVCAVLDAVLLVFAVQGPGHNLDEASLGILLEQRIPVPAPDDLDHVPARAPEDRLQFLNDLPVAANGPVEALEVAVDDEDQVVQLLPGGE